MPLGKQAKILTPDQEFTAVAYIAEMARHPARDAVLFLLSVKAGLRAKEIAALEWGMVTDTSGCIGDFIALPNRASKGHGGGRQIPLNATLKSALETLLGGDPARHPDAAVIRSERGGHVTANYIAIWFHRLYKALGFNGASSHSGRRTFVTRTARNCTAAGGSLRDVQEMAGHASLATTQRYIEGDSDAKRRMVALV